MLEAGGDVIPLDAADPGGGGKTDQERVLARRFHNPSPTRIVRKIQYRRVNPVDPLGGRRCV